MLNAIVTGAASGKSKATAQLPRNEAYVGTA